MNTLESRATGEGGGGQLPLDVIALNRAAAELLERARTSFSGWGIKESRIGGALVWDFRTAPDVPGPGELLAQASAGAALQVICVPGTETGSSATSFPRWVEVSSSQPAQACLGAQYAGWPLNHAGYFAMVSGPIRGVRGREPVLAHFDYDLASIRQDRATPWVAVLESDELPPVDAIQLMASQCGCDPKQLWICVAGTASPAGTLQVVARSLETALHQWETLGGGLGSITRGVGRAPLPPIAAKSLTAIGWTNDAIIFHGEVEFQVVGDWATLNALAEQVPSARSASFGQSFLQLFKAANYDFYRLDPRLFSPAVLRLHGDSPGQTASFGVVRPDLLQQSWQA